MKPDEFGNFLGKMVLVAFAAALVAVGFYWWHFRGQMLSDRSDAWGQFGDFFGGTLNPVFGLLSLFVLLLSLQVQRATLHEARNQGVLQELQRLMASVAHDVDTTRRAPVERRQGLLWALLLQDAQAQSEPSREVTVAEGLRQAWRLMLEDRMSYSGYTHLSASAESEEVFRALLRLDDCLVEFKARGGDGVVGLLYGRAYGDAARVLAALHAVSLPPVLEAAYSVGALDRLGLQRHDEQLEVVRANFEKLKTDRQRRMEEH